MIEKSPARADGQAMARAGLWPLIPALESPVEWGGFSGGNIRACRGYSDGKVVARAVYWPLFARWGRALWAK